MLRKRESGDKFQAAASFPEPCCSGASQVGLGSAEYKHPFYGDFWGGGSGRASSSSFPRVFLRKRT